MKIPEGSYVSIEGKTLRGSRNKSNGIDALHLLHAYSYEYGVVIGQLECYKEKTNEIPVSKELVDMLKLKDTVITADAMLCQKEVIAKIAKNNDYIIAIKGNQRYMFEGVKQLFECKAEKKRSFIKTFNKGHGRIETRKYTLDTNIHWLDNHKEWKNIKAFVMCESVVISKGKERIERRYFITSLTDVKKVAKGIRSHWAIENNLHWSLDMLFSDDACKVLDRNVAENLAIIRRIIYNRLKMLSKDKPFRLSKRFCAYDDDFRLKILFSC